MEAQIGTINCRDIKKDAQAVPSVNIQGISRLSDIIIPALLYHPGYTFSCPSDTVGKSLIKIIVNQIDKITHTFSKSTIINGIKPLEVIQNIENVTIDAGWGNDTMKKYGLNPASNRYLMNIFETAGSFIDPATRPKPNNSASIFFQKDSSQNHPFNDVGLNVTLNIQLASPPPPTQETLLTFTIKPFESNNIFPESPLQFTLDRYGSLYEFKEETWQRVNAPDERVTDINGIPIFKYIAGNKTKNNFINDNSGVSDISVNQEIALYTIFKEIGDTFQVLYLKYIINTLKSDVYKLYAEKSKHSLRVIGDISCDIEGGIECTLKVTDPGNPVYVYEPRTDSAKDGIAGHGPVIMAVDNLPSELPREASIYFSEILKAFIPALVNADYTVAYDDLNLPLEIKNALIVYQGKLTSVYKYLEKYLPAE